MALQYSSQQQQQRDQQQMPSTNNNRMEEEMSASEKSYNEFNFDSVEQGFLSGADFLLNEKVGTEDDRVVRAGSASRNDLHKSETTRDYQTRKF